MNENINEPSILSIGNYEILFSSAPNGDKVVQYLNNGSVKSSDIDLKYSIKFKDETKSSISSVDFLMPRDEAKLSDIFETTPYGLIKKNRTGVGATTLELKSKRNSIVVVPTRALAYNKAKRTKIRNTRNKYEVLYVGGNINGFRPQSIDDYLTDEMISNKKFIVVADSLPKLLEKIGIENYKDYFFMVDEVDSYQYDSWYRPALENVIDYYFEFSPKKRCLVSATVGSFSNKKIEEEPVINVLFNEPKPRDIKLLHTNNVIATAVKKINSLIEEHPNEKILIAYNSVRSGILQIIKSLDESLRIRCAILCGNNSKTYANHYYSEIVEEELPNQITFMTSSYFVGVDIKERFHLISIAESSPKQVHTLLSEDKLEQIAGRCRHEDELFSETIIYQSRADIINSVWLFPPTIEELEKDVLDDTFLLINHINTIPKLKNIYKGLRVWINKIQIDAIVHNSFKSYYDARSVRLLREDIHEKIQPAYLNIDNILIQFNILNTLYFSKRTLEESLLNQGNRVVWDEVVEPEERISIEVQGSLEEYIRTVEVDEIEDIIVQLRSKETIEERDILAKILKFNATLQGVNFINRFTELQGYVPFNSLTEILVQLQYKTQDKYNKFYNSVMFWALSEEHSFKIAFKGLFPLETPLPSEDIKTNLNGLLTSNLGYSVGTSYKAVRDLQIFCKISDRVRNRELGNPYFILNYDVNNFGTPLNTIDATTNISELFRFPRNVLTS